MSEMFPVISNESIFYTALEVIYLSMKLRCVCPTHVTVIDLNLLQEKQHRKYFMKVFFKL